MFSHHLDEYLANCVCGSAWNFYEKDCSSFYPPMPVPSDAYDLDDDDIDYGYFECSHGHAHCGRH